MQGNTLTVNNMNCIQEHFYGAGGVYHHYATALDFPERRYTSQQQETEFNRVADMQLKLARTYFDYCAYKNGVWDWENDEMQAFYKWLEAMKERGITVMIGACWWLRDHLYTGKDSPFYDENPRLAALKYGSWVSDLVHNVIEVRGFTNVKYLIMFTEPNDATATLHDLYPDLPSFEPYAMAVRAAHNRLIADGRRHLVKLVGPNEAALGLAYAGLLRYASENLSDCLDVFSAHAYLKENLRGETKTETHSGEWSVNFNIPGYRLWQNVVVKPHTDYKFSFYAKSEKVLRKESRGIYFGAFYENSAHYSTITAGNMGLSNLTENSVTYVSENEISPEWKKYTVIFNSGNNRETSVGVFHDIIDESTSVFYDDFSLVELGKTEQLLSNPDFELGRDNSWKIYPTMMSLQNNSETFKEYNFWKNISTGYLSVIPKGKEFCFDEYNAMYLDRFSDAKQGVCIACAQCALINSGVNSSLIWSLFDQFWPKCTWDGFDNFVCGDHRHGLMPAVSRSLVPYPSYYAFTLISKYMGDGDAKVFEGDAADGICVSCVKGRDGHYSVLLVNTTDTERAIELKFVGSLTVTLNRHLYDSQKVKPDEKAEIIGIDKTFDVSNLLSDSLPANSFAIYTTRED